MADRRFLCVVGHPKRETQKSVSYALGLSALYLVAQLWILYPETHKPFLYCARSQGAFLVLTAYLSHKLTHLSSRILCFVRRVFETELREAYPQAFSVNTRNFGR
jgi:hypothetical protein